MRRLVPTAAIALLAGVAVAPAASSATLLRLDGVGPVRLGMSRMAALDTGWLSNRHRGCPLGGRPYPIDYDLDGASAPRGLQGTAEFTGGELTNLAVSGGVRTAVGVVPGATSWPAMVRKYRAAGFRVAAGYEPTFGGTFVTVRRRGRQVMSGFAERGKPISVLGLPAVPVCE